MSCLFQPETRNSTQCEQIQLQTHGCCQPAQQYCLSLTLSSIISHPLKWTSSKINRCSIQKVKITLGFSLLFFFFLMLRGIKKKKNNEKENKKRKENLSEQYLVPFILCNLLKFGNSCRLLTLLVLTVFHSFTTHLLSTCPFGINKFSTSFKKAQCIIDGVLSL